MHPQTQIVSRLDYCLFVSQVKYLLTNFAEHSEKFSHDALPFRRTLDSFGSISKSQQFVQTTKGFVIFDDTVLDKRHSHKIEMARCQYSGNAHFCHQKCWDCQMSTQKSINFGSSTIGFMTRTETEKVNSIISWICCPIAFTRKTSRSTTQRPCERCPASVGSLSSFTWKLNN